MTHGEPLCSIEGRIVTGLHGKTGGSRSSDRLSSGHGHRLHSNRRTIQLRTIQRLYSLGHIPLVRKSDVGTTIAHRHVRQLTLRVDLELTHMREVLSHLLRRGLRPQPGHINSIRGTCSSSSPLLGSRPGQSPRLSRSQGGLPWRPTILHGRAVARVSGCSVVRHNTGSRRRRPIGTRIPGSTTGGIAGHWVPSGSIRPLSRRSCRRSRGRSRSRSPGRSTTI